MEKRVTLPLETALAGIPGLQYTSSFSRNGLSQITCYFEDDVDIYFARTQVAERLREAKEGLPRRRRAEDGRGHHRPRRGLRLDRRLRPSRRQRRDRQRRQARLAERWLLPHARRRKTRR